MSTRLGAGAVHIEGTASGAARLEGLRRLLAYSLNGISTYPLEGPMGAVSLWHWIVALLFLFIFLFPLTKILQKAGYSG